MLIVTTIYCADLDSVKAAAAEKPAGQNVAAVKELSRELVSIYQGKNRVQPMD